MVFPMPRSLVCPGRLKNARAGASSNHSPYLLRCFGGFSPKLRWGAFHPGSLGKKRRRITVTGLRLGTQRRLQVCPDCKMLLATVVAIYPPDPMAFELFAGVGTVFPVERENEFDAICATTPTIASWLEQQHVRASQARDYISRLFLGVATGAVERPSAVSNHWPLLTPLPAA